MRKRIRLKRYAIHVLPVPAIGPDVFDTPWEKNAIICCAEQTNRFLEGGHLRHKLILPFLDVEDKTVPGAFNGAHARAIIRFLQSLPDSVTDIYFCCSKGGSRSPALAAAILRASGRSDADVWRNPFYVPNTLVYFRMRRELGRYIPYFAVLRKKRMNEKQFRKAKRRGDPGEYERWIIFD